MGMLPSNLSSKESSVSALLAARVAPIPIGDYAVTPQRFSHRTVRAGREPIMRDIRPRVAARSRFDVILVSSPVRCRLRGRY